MPKNDLVLVDGIIDDRLERRVPSDQRDEVFELFAFEQILKDYDLSAEEVAHGSTDGRRDGGVDGFFVLVNGHLLQDPESFIWPRSSTDLRLILITCKHHDSFRQATLDALIATISELLDFSIENQALTGSYSDAILRRRSNLRFAYRKLSPRLTNFSVEVFYASRGDTSKIGSEVFARGLQVVTILKSSFGGCNPTFSFVGASELVELHRKLQTYTLELPFVEYLGKGERYVLLARLSDFFAFVSDEGRLRRYLFDSNVRDFMGLNRVNEDIRSTLRKSDSPDFWWLNNGVTILATSAAITGKSIQIADIQIVNGLQTTESIFRHYSQLQTTIPDERCVLVKVIVTSDAAVRDAIIRATNNQTDVELSALHATDKIQRDIEDVLLRNGLYYERRRNFYANQGHSTSDLVTPLYAAAGFVSLILKAPHAAASLRSKFMRSERAYAAVFDENVPLEVWPKIVDILKRVDEHLEALRPDAKVTEKFLKGWRHITALLLMAQHFGRFTFGASDLVDLDLGLITADEVRRVWTELSEHPTSSARMGGWATFRNVFTACEASAKKHGIGGVMALKPPRFPPNPFARLPSPEFHLTEEFVAQVKALLPPQPWKPGLDRRVSEQLGCERAIYFAAVDRLIDEGHFLRQRDGVLFDLEGNVVAFDEDRVDPETLELRDSFE